jgi:hypothetical protein
MIVFVVLERLGRVKGKLKCCFFVDKLWFVFLVKLGAVCTIGTIKKRSPTLLWYLVLFELAF